MNIIRNAKYTEWIKNRQNSKNMVGQKSVSSAAQNPTAKEIVHTKNINYSRREEPEAKLYTTAKMEYTKIDAIRYRSERQNGIDNSEYDFEKLEMYLEDVNDYTDITSSVEYLSSGYITAKTHIEKSYHGEIKAGYLLHLENIFNEKVENTANSFSDKLGVMFDGNEVINSKDKIYNSVLNGYNKSVKDYSKYISSNKDYAKISGTADEWLKNDDVFMAAELRKQASTEKSEVVETNDSLYSVGELSKAYKMVLESDKYKIGSMGREINIYSSDEEVGIKLSEFKLKGEVFKKYSNASKAMNKSMLNFVDTFIKTTAEGLKRLKEQLRKEMLEPHKMADYKTEEVFGIIDMVLGEYEKGGDMPKAMKAGSAFAKTQYDIQAGKTEISDRLDSGYWKEFFEKDGLKKDWLGSYDKSMCGFEELANSWNEFAMELTDDTSILISSSEKRLSI